MKKKGEKTKNRTDLGHGGRASCRPGAVWGLQIDLAGREKESKEHLGTATGIRSRIPTSHKKKYESQGIRKYRIQSGEKRKQTLIRKKEKGHPQDARKKANESLQKKSLTVLPWEQPGHTKGKKRSKTGGDQ